MPMRLRSMLTVSLACALPFTGIAVAGDAAARPAGTGAVRSDECPGGPVDPPHPELYYCGQARLGPAALPNTEPVATMLRGYQRFGGLSATHFVQLYANTDPQQSGRWIYPPDRGFQRINDVVDKTRWTVPQGTKLDRFGALHGGYFSDPGTPFNQRSVTPDSLNPDPDRGKAYFCLSVLKPFDVWRGHTAAFYGMPGGGVQEWLDRDLKPAELGDKDYKIDVLVNEKYLAVIGDDECAVTPTGA
ncbi:TNT domain-containing protein [Kitasatospora sp. NPDC056184]|uniref:TNT domain-containing protein n=1 Tax=Kitasatospora sp. NPDC056184 TaxID=3345738 RepID=UPI0035E31137